MRNRTKARDGEGGGGGGGAGKCECALVPGHAGEGGLTFMMPHCLLSSFFPDIARAA